jgi:hypothetical protein
VGLLAAYPVGHAGDGEGRAAGLRMAAWEGEWVISRTDTARAKDKILML